MGNCCVSKVQADLVAALDALDDDGKQKILFNSVYREVENSNNFLQVSVPDTKYVENCIVSDYRSKEPKLYTCKKIDKDAITKFHPHSALADFAKLRNEVEILKILAGGFFCEQMQDLFESSKSLIMVTEYYAGGDLMEYISELDEDMRTEDVSRIAYQLFQAIDHCHNHGVIHRDISHESIKFKRPYSGSELRLTNFASGTMDSCDATDNKLKFHSTLAGKPFYRSPEMIFGKYNSRTDIFSAGVVLYVLVAGYPAEDLQNAFNILQTREKEYCSKDLPNLPEKMPHAFLDLMNNSLTHDPNLRPPASELLKHEFVTFHQLLERELKIIKAEEAVRIEKPDSVEENATTSVSPTNFRSLLRHCSFELEGSRQRHTEAMHFKNFERNITTLMAAMLSKEELKNLISILRKRTGVKSTFSEANKIVRVYEDATETTTTSDIDIDCDAVNIQEEDDEKLAVIKVSELIAILTYKIKNDEVVKKINWQCDASHFDNMMYHVELLEAFCKDTENKSHSVSTAKLGGMKNTRKEDIVHRHSFEEERDSLHNSAKFDLDTKAQNMLVLPFT